MLSAPVPPEKLGEAGRKPAAFPPVASVVSTRAINGAAAAPAADFDAQARPQAPDTASVSRLMEASCRALDVVGAAVLLVVLSPLLLAIAIAVRLDTPGPALFRQRRLGRNVEPFTVHKFRTMEDGVPEDYHREYVTGLITGETGGESEPPTPSSQVAHGPRYKLSGDPRVTRCGRLLRRSSLDELPQLWNVLRGEMSLVGPRPPIPYEVAQYPPHWFARFAVKPGVTGLWQVNGRSDVTLEEMVRLDVEYIERRSLRLNIAIILKTLPAVLSARGAW